MTHPHAPRAPFSIRLPRGRPQWLREPPPEARELAVVVEP